jgi:hypothetical protein
MRGARAERITRTTMTNAETNDNKAAAVAEQAPNRAPEKAPSKKGASQKKSAPKGRKTAEGATKAAAPGKRAKGGKKEKAAKSSRAKASTPRAESKGAKILDMIGRAKGATLAEIMKALSWQAHSVRGFISIAAKKQGIKIESSKNDAGERLYKIAK